MTPARGAAALVAVALGLAAGSGPPPSASAVWTSPAVVNTTGTLGMPLATYSFSGAVPATYTVNYNVLSFNDTDYPVLTNTGATAARFAGTVSGSALIPGGATVTVRTCATAWAAGSCAGGATTLLNAGQITAVPALNYQVGVIASGGRSYLQVKVSGFSLTATITLAVTSSLLATGGSDRTAG
jgi:hypothetical protein